MYYDEGAPLNPVLSPPLPPSLTAHLLLLRPVVPSRPSWPCPLTVVAPVLATTRAATAMSRSTPSVARDSVASAHTVANLVRVLQALRRSIKGDKDKNPQLSISPKAAVAIVPPKKVG